MRAADWFEQHGNLDEAFKHALASGDNEWAAALFEHNVETMIKAGEPLALTCWTRKLPDEVIHQHPSPALSYIWGLISASELDLARFWIEDVQQTLNELERRQGSEPGLSIPSNWGLSQANEGQGVRQPFIE